MYTHTYTYIKPFETRPCSTYGLSPFLTVSSLVQRLCPGTGGCQRHPSAVAAGLRQSAGAPPADVGRLELGQPAGVGPVPPAGRARPAHHLLRVVELRDQHAGDGLHQQDPAGHQRHRAQPPGHPVHGMARGCACWT